MLRMRLAISFRGTGFAPGPPGFPGFAPDGTVILGGGNQQTAIFGFNGSIEPPGLTIPKAEPWLEAEARKLES